MIVEIWICPDDGNYYGSSNAGDLNAQWNTDLKGDRTHQRSRCPTCGSPRVLHRVEVEVKGAEHVLNRST